MKREKTRTKIFLSIGVLIALAACGNKESIYDLDKPGEIAEVKKEIIAAAGDVLAYEIRLTSQTELETSMDAISIVTSDEAQEETLNRIDFQLTQEGEPNISIIDSEFSVRVHKKNEPKKISDIDFNLIEKNIETAKSLISSEYVDHSLYEYQIEFEDNKRADTFILNCLLEGENDHIEGRDVVTNYYEFEFEMDENGAVIMSMD
ncbi:MAG: hypothetical protein GQ574_05915 [Crocinitomix sp.]|nr:hypothetical protein [Crocinitomix sp.]